MISIILPTYNVAKYIERCINSLNDQDFKDIEMLFIDDCGQDESRDIINSFAQYDPRIKIITNKYNMGTHHARKVGVDNAKGDYILFLDPDDELEKSFLTLLNDKISEKKVDMIFHGVKCVPKEKWYQKKLRALPFSESKNLLKAIYKRGGKKVVSCGLAGKVYERRFISDVYNSLSIDPDFKYTYEEDKLLFYAAVLRNPTYNILKSAGYIYHYNDSSITNKNKLQNPEPLIKQLEFTINEIEKLVSQYKLDKEDRNFFNFLLNHSAISQMNLMRRYENNGENYLHYVLKAYRSAPSINQIIRILAFGASFGKLKL